MSKLTVNCLYLRWIKFYSYWFIYVHHHRPISLKQASWGLHTMTTMVNELHILLSKLSPMEPNPWPHLYVEITSLRSLLIDQRRSRVRVLIETVNSILFLHFYDNYISIGVIVIWLHYFTISYVRITLTCCIFLVRKGGIGCMSMSDYMARGVKPFVWLFQKYRSYISLLNISITDNYVCC